MECLPLRNTGCTETRKIHTDHVPLVLDDYGDDDAIFGQFSLENYREAFCICLRVLMIYGHVSTMSSQITINNSLFFFAPFSLRVNMCLGAYLLNYGQGSRDDVLSEAKLRLCNIRVAILFMIFHPLFQNHAQIETTSSLSPH